MQLSLFEVENNLFVQEENYAAGMWDGSIGSRYPGHWCTPSTASCSPELTGIASQILVDHFTEWLISCLINE